MGLVTTVRALGQALGPPMVAATLLQVQRRQTHQHRVRFADGRRHRRPVVDAATFLASARAWPA